MEKEGVDYTVWETNGALPDEMVAQRLAMIPIPTDHEMFHYEETCPTCKDLIPEDRGCPTCNMIYTCKAFGTEEGMAVTAGDMIYLGDQSLEIPEHYRSIPITKLYKGQMLEFYATAVMGRGSQHAKWSPVCGVAFAPRQVGILNNKTKAKILWDLNLTINAKDFDKDGRLDDIEKVAGRQETVGNQAEADHQNDDDGENAVFAGEIAGRDGKPPGRCLNVAHGWVTSLPRETAPCSSKMRCSASSTVVSRQSVSAKMRPSLIR